MPEDVAGAVLDAMSGDEPFLITPHDRVRDSFRRTSAEELAAQHRNSTDDHPGQADPCVHPVAKATARLKTAGSGSEGKAARFSGVLNFNIS